MIHESLHAASIQVAFDLFFEHKNGLAWKGPAEGWVRTQGITRYASLTEFAGVWLNTAFATNLHDLATQEDLWILGHTHKSFDY